MAGQDDGWETITDPGDVPADIRKSLGVAGVRTALGLSTGTGASGKAIPEWADKKYSPQIETFAGLSNALSTFKDDYGGNTLTGGLENTFQGAYSGFGTEGQRDWWAQFKSNDNQIRNKLFGASLTDGEKAAYEATTVNPSMDPKEIRRNLTTRRGIIQKALQRTTKFLQAQGYNEDSIAALAGEYAPELGAVPATQAKGGDRDSGTAGAVADGSSTPPAGPAGGGPDSRGEVQFNDEGPQLAAGVSKLTPEAQEKLYQFSLTKPSATQLKQYYDTLGAGTLPDANAQQIADYYAKGGKERIGVNYKDAEVTPIDPGDGSVGAFARGVTSNVPFSREIAAGIDTLSSGDTTYAENLAKQQGFRAFNEENNGTAYTLGAVAGSLPLGGIEFAGARQAAAAAGRAALRGGVPIAEARVIANRAFAARTAVEAAAQAGAYGVGNADGSAVDRLATGAASAGVGAVTGGVGALAGGRFARALAARRAARLGQPLTDGQEVAQAAERAQIIPFPADTGGAMTRRATSAAAQTIGGSGPIAQGAQATLDSAQAARDRIAAGIGQVVGAEETGNIARRGVDAYRARTSAQIGRIYDAAETAGGQVRVQTPEALRVLNQELPSLEESPVQGAGVGILQGLRDQLQGDLTVRGLRNARTVLREEFENNGLRRSNTERIADRVLDAATDDIVNGLRAQGQDRAANLYQRADRLWRERLANIDENLTPIIGDATGPGAKSGEQIVTALKQAMSGNNRRFAGFIGTLPPEERSIVRASLISRLGQATKGQQDETGERFSLATFLTNWNEIGNSAKNTLFGADGRAALNDLAIYARGSKEAQRYANHSNTAGAGINWWTAASGAGAWGTFGATIIAENLTGRLLSSPAVARWLARAPRVRTPAQAQAQLDRLTRIARAEPAIANEVLSLQQRLTDAFSSTPARLAANERPDRGASVQGQTSDDQAANQGLQP